MIIIWIIIIPFVCSHSVKESISILQDDDYIAMYNNSITCEITLDAKLGDDVTLQVYNTVTGQWEDSGIAVTSSVQVRGESGCWETRRVTFV